MFHKFISKNNKETSEPYKGSPSLELNRHKNHNLESLGKEKNHSPRSGRKRDEKRNEMLFVLNIGPWE